MSAEDLTEIFKILSSRVKLSIIEALGPDKKLSFKELMENIGGEVYSSLLSNHLRALRNMGYIEQDDDGKYMLSERGVALYNIVLNAKNYMLSSYGLRVLTREQISYTLEKYLASAIPLLLSPQASHSKYQKIVANIIDSLATGGSETVTEDRVLLHILAEAFRLNIIEEIPEKIRVSIEEKIYPRSVLERVEHVVSSFTYKLIREKRLASIFKDNAVYMKAFPNGFLQIHLIDPDPEELANIAKKHVFFGSLVLEYSRGLSRRDIETIEILDSFLPVTLILKSVGEGEVKEISSRLFLNTLFVLTNIATDKDFIKNITLLVNSGNSILLTSSKLIPSLTHFPVTAGKQEFLLLSLSFLLPLLYPSTSGGVKPEEYMDLVCGDIVEGVVWSQGGLFEKARRAAGILGLGDATPTIQLSFVGLEALFLRLTPYFEIVKDEESTPYAARYIGERAAHLLSQNICGDPPSRHGFQLYSTFFAPLHPYHRALSHTHAPGKTPLHRHVNTYTALSLNATPLRTYLAREARVQTLYPHRSLSIAEIKLGARTSAFEVEDIVKLMGKHDIKTYTLSLSGLARCTTCHYTTPYLRDVCPRCYSRTISRLYRPILAYLEDTSTLLDRYMIDEYSSRPVFSRPRRA